MLLPSKKAKGSRSEINFASYARGSRTLRPRLVCLLRKTNAFAKSAPTPHGKISNDVRDLGPCGRQTLTDVYIMLNEAANGGGE
jgi:hypothetical protein